MQWRDVLNVHPNETLVKAVVKVVKPCDDGYGHEMDLEILTNESPDPANDFLQPKPGDRVMVFDANLGDVKDGQQIQATLALVGGPQQERAVLRQAQKLPIKP